ncbi:RNA-splicing ligase RtcB [Abditibacteriota bacterium]|nr:RNA-splicing ligase RtcB [Abditibacteriota bacterium]
MITGKTLKNRGWKEGRTVGLAKIAAHELEARGLDESQILSRLDEVLADPQTFLGDTVFTALADELIRRDRNDQSKFDDALRAAPVDYQIWGRDGIDAGAIEQMDNAARLPIAVAGALMPDAHVGYGLPIGGVLATRGAVIPYAVGVDIACRMRLSIYEMSPHILGQQKNKFENALRDQTKFGAGKNWGRNERREHDVLDDPDWSAYGLLRKLRYKAEEQLGTSGSGNHFVEWGMLELSKPSHELGLEEGTYLALLSHSGSRGVGFQIANVYSRHANSLHPQLADKVRHLAWLDMDSEAGQEYWLGMELAGKFAAANHYVIHREVAKAVGLKEIASVENHHNFAWKEMLADGEEAIVHRKGATPAGQGVLGVIPGSMADAGYVVRGKGLKASLKSASHGAGRKLGRKAAIGSITKLMRDRYVQERGVKVLGGGLDEAPQAYKNIEEVIAAQRDLVDVIAKFSPRIVMMADEAGDT